MFAFYLMTEKGYAVLKSLVKHDLLDVVDCIIGAKDKNVQKDFFDEICTLCAENGLLFYERTKAPLSKATYSIAISWRWLIDTPNLIVLHDSLLPRYRGFAPLVAALINGEREVGVTALFADATFDTGGIIAQESMAVSYPVKIADAIQNVSNLYSAIVVDIIDKLKTFGTIASKEQDHTKASYSLWRDEEDYRIDWEKPANEIARFIDAVGFPYKGAVAMVDNQQARILDVVVVADVKIEIRSPGKVLFMEEGKPIVVCGAGLLRINNMTWTDGTNALPLKNFRTRFK